jgi:hypothetical protein
LSAGATRGIMADYNGKLGINYSVTLSGDLMLSHE